MKFGAVPVSEAVGATAVHSIRQGDLVLKQHSIRAEEHRCASSRGRQGDRGGAARAGRRLRRSCPAADIAAALGGDGAPPLDRAFTGRCNLFADRPGILVLDRDAIDRLNRVDEAGDGGDALPPYKPGSRAR